MWYLSPRLYWALGVTRLCSSAQVSKFLCRLCVLRLDQRTKHYEAKGRHDSDDGT